MFGFLRFALIALLALSLLHMLIKIYARSLVRERLEDEWAQSDMSEPRSDHVKRGLEHYQHSMRRKLLLGVYLFPMIIFCVVFYTINFM